MSHLSADIPLVTDNYLSFDKCHNMRNAISTPFTQKKADSTSLGCQPGVHSEAIT